jgi:hypothetical protein
MEKYIPARVQRKLGFHGPDDRKFIHARCCMREKFTYRSAALSVLLELPKAAKPLTVRTRDIVFEFGRFAIQFGKLRLGIEAFHVGHAAWHEEKYDVLRFRGEMGLS